MDTINYETLKQKLNQSVIFLKDKNLKCTKLSKGSATCELTISKDLCNPYGMVHGGVLYTLADTAVGCASFTSGKSGVTLNGSMNYIKPVFKGKIIAIAQEVSMGKTTGIYQVQVFNEEKRLLATSTFTMYFKEDLPTF